MAEQRIRLTKENVQNWTRFSKLLQDGKVKFDSQGRLRYLHGAPVGDLVLIRVNKDGTAKYKEAANEWFDPDSGMAREFIWP